MHFSLGFLAILSDMKTILLFFAKLGAVISDIVLEPSNTAVVEGEWMNMNCLTINQSEVRKWSFYSYNRIASTIYRPGFSGRLRGLFEHFDVEINANGPVSISANSTRLNDAGVYTCHCGIDGRDAEYKAHLIVLESLPFCESNLTRNNSQALADGDHIWILCSINFRGFLAPSMEWTQHGGDFGPPGNRVTDGIETMNSPSHSVMSKLTITVNSSTNGSYYSCKIYFARYSSTEVTTTANNVPDFIYTWNSSVVHVHVHVGPVDLSSSSTQSVFAASDAGTSSAVTSSTTERPCSVDWYLVSLSLVAALSIFCIAMVARAVVRCLRVKKTVSGTCTYHYESATKDTFEMPAQESTYDTIPYATSDNYETIGEEDTDPRYAPSCRPSLGLLPTPGYAGLMPLQPSVPSVYSQMETYATPVDIVPDSTLTKVEVATEVTPENAYLRLETESPPKESQLSAPKILMS